MFYEIFHDFLNRPQVMFLVAENVIKVNFHIINPCLKKNPHFVKNSFFLF